TETEEDQTRFSEELLTFVFYELKVAFSAGLTDSGSVGPFDEETTLIFSKTITNIGRAYDQTAGVFTAPVRGVYFFSFTAADYLKGYMGLYLYWNNQPVVFNLELNDHGGYASTSNAVALQLEEGDRIRLSLPASYRLYDDNRNFSKSHRIRRHLSDKPSTRQKHKHWTFVLVASETSSGSSQNGLNTEDVSGK
uniref:C1q domain-containing protein n=1 Tax=Stegastes partitus TaxID=144197 RepID=A0A3B4Z9F3_9TELE